MSAYPGKYVHEGWERRMQNTNIASIVITTKNRVDDLVVAVQSAIEQTVDCEIIVIDDGSTDQTATEIRSRFNSVRLIRHEQSLGYIVRRNEGAQLASCEIVFSIDDDAAFVSKNTVKQTLAEFSDPHVGAIAIPFIDIRKGPKVCQSAPAADGVFVTASFIGTAHALRREMFLQLGGYRSFLKHQGEEGDYCIRMLSHGFLVRLGRADPIHHFESPKRDYRRMDIYGRRNDILFCWYNAPLSDFPISLAGTVVNGLRHGVRCGRFFVMVQGLLTGFAAITRVWGERAPVSKKCYSLFRRLKKCNYVEIGSIVGQCPKS